MSPRARWSGAAFVAAGVAFQALWLGLPAALLSLMLVVSYFVWLSTPWRVGANARAAFLAAVVVFLAHFAEEYRTGFAVRLPELIGRPPWTPAEFLTFNGVWAVVFASSALALRPGRDLPVLVALFFALAGGLGNGVFHLVLAIQSGGYFPGAWTAPLCFGVGVWMLRALYR